MGELGVVQVERTLSRRWELCQSDCARRETSTVVPVTFALTPRIHVEPG